MKAEQYLELLDKLCEDAYPCKYGHNNCSVRYHGRCSDEIYNNLSDEDREVVDENQ
jgi:hypothetical protein